MGTVIHSLTGNSHMLCALPLLLPGDQVPNIITETTLKITLHPPRSFLGV